MTTRNVMAGGSALRIGLDLDNTETRLAIQLALRIHRMTERG